MKVAQITKREKLNNLKERLLGNGKEPVFTPMNSNRAGMMNGLNFYRDHFEQSDRKTFSLVWVKVALPHLYTKLAKLNEDLFENRGFVCRMVENGYVLSAKELTNHIAFFERIAVAGVPEKADEDAPKAAKPKAASTNPFLDTIEYVMDSVITNSDPEALDLEKATKTQLQQVIERCNRTLVEIESDEEGQYNKLTAKKIKAKFTKIVADAQALTEKKPVRATKVMPIKKGVRAISVDNAKAKAVATKVPFCSGVPELGLVGISPDKAVGATQMVAYQKDYGQLRFYTAADASGFSFAGSTMKNVVVESCVFKRVRSPEKAFKGATMTVEGLTKLYGSLTTSEGKHSPRFNEGLVILAVK